MRDMAEKIDDIKAGKGSSNEAPPPQGDAKEKTRPPAPGMKSGVKLKKDIGIKEGAPQPGMCAYHKELPAAFICNRCGKSICTTCAIRYGQVVFCPQCSPFPGGYQPYTYPYYYPYYPYYPYYRQPTNVASTGGLLVLFAGILGFIYIATLITFPSGYGFINPFDFGTPEAIFCLSFPLISSSIAVVGGMYGYHKVNFSVAVVGGIFSIFVVGFYIGSILGLVGLILIGTGRFEFDDVKAQMSQQPGQTYY